MCIRDSLETAQIDVDGIGSHTANALYQYRNRLQVIEEGTLNALAGSNAVSYTHLEPAGQGNTAPGVGGPDRRVLRGKRNPDFLQGQPAGLFPGPPALCPPLGRPRGCNDRVGHPLHGAI